MQTVAHTPSARAVRNAFGARANPAKPSVSRLSKCGEFLSSNEPATSIVLLPQFGTAVAIWALLQLYEVAKHGLTYKHPRNFYRLHHPSICVMDGCM